MSFALPRVWRVPSEAEFSRVKSRSSWLRARFAGKRDVISAALISKSHQFASWIRVIVLSHPSGGTRRETCWQEKRGRKFRICLVNMSPGHEILQINYGGCSARFRLIFASSLNAEFANQLIKNLPLSCTLSNIIYSLIVYKNLWTFADGHCQHLHEPWKYMFHVLARLPLRFAIDVEISFHFNLCPISLSFMEC